MFVKYPAISIMFLATNSIHATCGLVPCARKEVPVLNRAAEAGVMWGMPFRQLPERPYLFYEEYHTVGEDVFKGPFCTRSFSTAACLCAETQKFILGRRCIVSSKHRPYRSASSDFDTTLIKQYPTAVFTLPDDVTVFRPRP